MSGVSASVPLPILSAACLLIVGILFGVILGRTWGVRRMINEAVRDADVAVRTDELTGLSNRRGFERCYERCRDGRRKSDWPVSVLFIDLDHFKTVNDTHGHPAGDLVLGHVARLVDESLRERDTVARLGGDEFVALLLGAALSEATEVAERVRADVESQSVPVGGVDWKGSVSIGAIEITRGEELASVLQRVDRAVYAAKQAGRNCVHAHDHSAAIT